MKELRRAVRLYGEYPDDSWGLLRGTYMTAARAGLSPVRIESAGLSIAKLNEIVGRP